MSLAQAQYYANPHNAFWRLMGAVLGEDLVALGYDDRLAALLKRGVGLWDVVAQAERQGSLDAAIRNASHSDLAGLADSLPNLRAVAFNGAASAKVGTKLLAGHADRLRLIPLPSSSPAHAARSFEQKAEAWMALREFVQAPQVD